MATLKQNSEALKAITDKLKSLPKKNELVELEVTENGEYNPPENADGFSKVTVATENKLAQYMSKTLTEAIEEDFGTATIIPTYAFQNNTVLESAKISSKITTVGAYAFNGCSNLKKVTMPTSVKTINNYAFQNCTSLQIELPNSLTSIGQYAFKGALLPSMFVIPEGVTGVTKWSFSGCIGVETLVVPSSIKNVPESCFTEIKTMTSLVLSEGIETIGRQSFYFCKQLESIVIPSTVTRINEYAFMTGYGVQQTVTVKAVTPPTLGSAVFEGTPVKIAVPIGSGDVYKSATNWSAYADKIVESEEAGGADTGNWLFQDMMLDSNGNNSLPAPVIGNSYTLFVDGEEIGTSRAESNWDGSAVLRFNTEDYRIYFLYDASTGLGWHFHPMDSQVQNGNVSIRININGGGTND